MLADDRAGAPASNVFWVGNLGEAGQFLHGYESTWLPASLLRGSAQKRLAEALFATSRIWRVSLHFNKGLAGAPAEALAAARDTAMNPAVLTAFGWSSSPAAGRRHSPESPGTSPIFNRRAQMR